MKKKSSGNPDEREKARELSDAEKRRLARFEELSADLVRRGYRRTELTVSIVRANLFALLLLIPLFAAGFGLLALRGVRTSMDAYGVLTMLGTLLLLFALIFVHELIHGACWAMFAEHGFRDIELGFMKQYLTPYCACCAPLRRGPYIFGALAPMVVLGVLPMIAGILTGSVPLLLIGIIMTDAAAGDILIVWKILRRRSSAPTVLYIDHPTQAGGVLFEK